MKPLKMQYDFYKLNEISRTINLLEYASNKFEFNRNGSSENYYCRCPNHNDNTPSLCINNTDNYFHCFSCGVSGNLLTWLTKVEHLSWNEAINKLQKLSGMEAVQLKQCEALAFFKQAKKLYDMKTSVGEIDRNVLPSGYMNNFSDEVPKEWVDEGIDPKVMVNYEIKIDHKANRIVYPLYDNDGRLVAAKGRTRFSQYKELKIAKYQFYQKIGELDFFAGWKQALPHIQENSEVYIFEGIKSVMHVNPWGYKNCISSETSYLSKGQVDWLIKQGIKTVILSYDSDIDLAKIRKTTEQLKKFTNVYALYDSQNLLGGKDAKCSPCDRGREVFEKLCQTKIKI